VKSKAESLRSWRKFQNAFHPRPSATERGYDADWRWLRADWLKAHPDCACGEHATIVDHIESIREHPERRLDSGNLQSMCFKCHHQKSMTWENTLGKRRPPA
jgi:5-methylcytosine-specific restriction endonuclease McrA